MCSLGRSLQGEASVRLRRQSIPPQGHQQQTYQQDDPLGCKLERDRPTDWSLKMRISSALCWSILLLVALLTHNVTTKGGRGGARGGARGSARGSRFHAKSSSRYGSFRVATGAAAAGAVAGAAAGMAGRRRWRYDDSSEDRSQWGNRTNEGSYSYRAWTSGAKTISASLAITLTPIFTTGVKFYYF